MLASLHLSLAIMAAALGEVTGPVKAAAPLPTPTDTSAFALQVGRPFHLPAGERMGAVVLIGDTARIEGAMSGPLVIVNGTAYVSGDIGDNVVVVGGHLELARNARIGHDVLLVRSTMTRAPGVRIGGTIQERSAFFTLTQRAVFLIWLSMTVAVAAAGLLFATFGRTQLREAAQLVRHDLGRTFIGTLALWLGLPLLAVLTIMTGIGIPLGIGVLVFLLPALWFLGYIVAGEYLGAIILPRLSGDPAAVHPFRVVVTGVVALQVIGLLPGLGGVLLMIAGCVGSGAIATRAWLCRRPIARSEQLELTPQAA